MDALKSFLNEIAARAIAKFKSAMLITKLMAVAAIVGIGFIVARIGLIGDAAEAFAWRIYPGNIPVIDAPPSVVGVDFELVAVRGGVPVYILRGEPCYSGEMIRIGVKPFNEAWVVVFGIAAQSGAYPISDRGYAAKLLGAGQTLAEDVKLDAVEGTEIFFALTAPAAFTVAAAQLEAARTALFPEGGKGGEVAGLGLEFGNAVAVSSYRCNHLSK